MGIKVLGSNLSTCSKRVTLLLEELEVPYELEDLDFEKQIKEEPYLSLQPFGQMPVLDDPDLGTTIFESRAIIRYLANKYPEKGLSGTDAKSRALVDTWLEVEAHNWTPKVSDITYQRLVVPIIGGKPDEELVKKRIAEWEPICDIFEKHLSKQDYVAGDFYSIADLSFLPNLQIVTSGAAGADVESVISSRPHLKAWADRIAGRPASKKIAAMH